MKKIKIAEPCQENWNDFTPTQRGAFCGSCQINVIDFSSKSNHEIKDILVENSGKKMCGRFSKSQLDDFNSDYTVWQNQSQPIFQSKFIFALVLVFGLTLFSCSNENDEVTMGTITTSFYDGAQQNTSLTDTTKTDSANVKTNNIEIKTIPDIPSCETDFEMGDMMIEEVPEIMVKGEIAPYELETMTMGKIAMPVEPDTIIPTKAQPMLLGMIDYPQISEPQSSIIVDSTKHTVVSLTDKFEANLFPNPTKNKATLNINVLVSENYTIMIYDSQGRAVKSIYKGKIDVESKSFRLDLGNQNSGIYYVNIVTDTQNESLKIIKTK